MENATSSLNKTPTNSDQVYIINEVNLTVETGVFEIDSDWPSVNGNVWFDCHWYNTEAEAYSGLLEFVNKSIKFLQDAIDEYVAAKKRAKAWLKGERKSVGMMTIVDVNGDEVEVPENDFLKELLDD